MAVHTKTIEYAFQSRNGAALAAATRYDFGAITLSIPETTSRTFRSVRLQVFCRDAVTTAANQTAPLLGIKLGAVAFADVTLGNPAANTGESVSYVYERDITAYFNTNFGAGGSQTCQVGVSFTGTTTVNIGAKLIITYECEDQQTRVKTARIPLDSGVGALTATLAQIGTNQIPALDTLLPEASKTYRRVWLELSYQETTVGTVNDASLGMQIDAGAEHLTGIHESGLASSCTGLYFWDLTGAFTTNAVHALNLRSSTITTASTFNHVALVLCVTYEYDHTNSTRILQSLLLPMMPISIPGGTAATDETGAYVDLWIEEPGTITMVQSGILAFYSQSANVNPSVKVGAGSEWTYTDGNAAYCGSSWLSHRVDSGGAGGAAFTLARGYNQLFWRVRISTSGVMPSGFQAFLLLNYTSDKHASGDGVHNKSTCWNVQDSVTSTTISVIAAAQWINIPESAYFVNSLAFLSMNVTGGQFAAMDIDVEAAAGELSASAYRNQMHLAFQVDAELGVYPFCVPCNKWAPEDWKRWSGDIEATRMDIEGSRRVKIGCLTSGTRPLSIWFTYHGITFTVAGTVSGSAGGTVTARAIRDVDGRREEVARTTRAGNGSVSMTVFDNVDDHYVEYSEDATHQARSVSGKPA